MRLLTEQERDAAKAVARYDVFWVEMVNNAVPKSLPDADARRSYICRVGARLRDIRRATRTKKARAGLWRPEFV